MTTEIAAAKLAKAYLRTWAIPTWDLRVFEYRNMGDTYLRIAPLLRALEGKRLTQLEEQSKALLLAEAIASVKSTPKYLLELLSTENYLSADDLKAIREKLGISQTELGYVLGGIPLRTIQDWEAGIARIPVMVAELLRSKGHL